jgi:3-dehydroquinate synthase
MKKLLVNLGNRSYPVLIGPEVLGKSGHILAGLGFASPPIVVSNARVMRLHGKVLLDSLERVFGRAPVIRIGDGERFKNNSSVERIYRGLFRARADRRSWILAFGGGVVGDVAGFAAATYMRGIPYVGVPTTLLAQVDSSIGGKVGINCADGKNLIGAFHQPAAVLSDTGTLRTLPARELACGLYEAVKCGAIGSASLLRYLDRHLDDVLRCAPASVSRVVLDAARIKAEVVAHDEREVHARMILNFGHTVGHALEAATLYRRFRHGEAVAWGMVAAAQFGGLEGREARRLLGLIHRIGKLPSLGGISAGQVWSALQRDKKSASGKIRMVLLQRLGQAAVVDAVDPARLKGFLTSFLAHP